MDRDLLVVISAVAVVNWMFGEWLWALFRVRRTDRQPRRALSAILNSFGSIAILYSVDVSTPVAHRETIAAAILVFCFVCFAGDFLSRRAAETGFPGIEVDVPGFDPERRPIFSAIVILSAQVGLLFTIAAVVA